MSYKIYFILLLPLFAFKCISKEMRKKIITVDNQLAKNVYCLPSFNYPDTTLNFIDKGQILANDSAYFIRASSQKKLFYKTLCDRASWNYQMTTDTLQVFVIEEKTLKENSWGVIYSHDLYLRRLLFSYTDIINNGCKITIR
jgi:hypothetical protein